MAKLTTILLAWTFSLLIAACSQGTSVLDPKSESASPSHAEAGALALEAGLILRSADVKPVARTDFFLLNRNLEIILEQSDYMAELPKDTKKVLDSMLTTSQKHVGVLTMLVKFSGDDERKDVEVLTRFRYSIGRAVAATRPFAVRSATTDFQGKARFIDVPPGSYYLFGYSNVGSSGAVWNVKIDIQPGENSVILDNNNAIIH